MGKRAGWAAYAAVWVLILLFVGCATVPTETQRQLNWQNVDAGDQLARHEDPVVAQTGKDVSANSHVLANVLIGKPQVVIPYTPELAAKVRAQALKEFEENQPWYKRFFGWVATGGVTLLMAGIALARYFPATAAIANVVEPLAKSLFSIKQKAEAHPEDVLDLDSITSEISTLAKDPKAGPVVSRLLERLTLNALVHAPEAPDLPTPSPTAA